MSAVYYEASRYHTKRKIECESLTEAIGCALADLESGEAWPCRILVGDVVVWEQSGPLTTGDSLETLAAADRAANNEEGNNDPNGN